MDFDSNRNGKQKSIMNYGYRSRYHDRTYVKRLLRGSEPGLWDLESHAAPPVRDVRIVWVAPIRYIKRAGP